MGESPDYLGNPRWLLRATWRKIKKSSNRKDDRGGSQEKMTTQNIPKQHRARRKPKRKKSERTRKTPREGSIKGRKEREREDKRGRNPVGF
jgi:hypothetical protein